MLCLLALLSESSGHQALAILPLLMPKRAQTPPRGSTKHDSPNDPNLCRLEAYSKS